MGNKTIGEILKDFRQTAKVVEYAPVVRGKWIFGKTLHQEWMKCSECLHSYNVTGVFSYCPNCGADMREVQNERD